MSYMVYMVSITYIIPLTTSIFCGAMIVRQRRIKLCRKFAFSGMSYMVYMVSITYIIPLATSIFWGAIIVRQRRIEQNNTICRNSNSSSSMVSITYIIPLTTSIFCGAMIVRQRRIKLCRKFAFSDMSYMVYMVSITYTILLATSIFCGAMIVRQVCNRPESANLGGQSQTRKVTIMVIGVVLLFALCWLPNHAINLWRVMNPRAPGSIPLYQFKFAAMCLSYANSAMNPFVYTFVGENFRVELHKLFQNICAKCWFPYSADSKKTPASAKGSNTSFKTAVTLTRSASGGMGQCETLPFRPVTPMEDEVYCPVVNVVIEDTKMAAFETNI
ncbi:receptor [Branchiostoma belcheri]|nr:receptor [Branchiostoma belcheri]